MYVHWGYRSQCHSNIVDEDHVRNATFINEGARLLKVSVDGGVHYGGSLKVSYHATPTFFGVEPLERPS